MAKPTDKQKPTRLTGVKVATVGLVDKGAVQKADFIVLSKRQERQDEGLSEIAQITKALTARDAFDASVLLRMMSDMVELKAAMETVHDRLPPEVQAGFEALKSAMFSKSSVEKAFADGAISPGEIRKLLELPELPEGGDGAAAVPAGDGPSPISEESIREMVAKAVAEAVASPQPEENKGDTTPVVEKRSEIEIANDLLAKRRREQAAAEAEQVAKALTSLTGTLERVLESREERFQHLESKLAQAQGQGD